MLLLMSGFVNNTFNKPKQSRWAQKKMLCLITIDIKALFFFRKDNNSLITLMAGNDRSLVNGYFLCVLD